MPPSAVPSGTRTTISIALRQLLACRHHRTAYRAPLRRRCNPMESPAGPVWNEIGTDGRRLERIAPDLGTGLERPTLGWLREIATRRCCQTE